MSLFKLPAETFKPRVLKITYREYEGDDSHDQDLTDLNMWADNEFEEKLYSKVRDSHATGQPRFMHNLLIQPKGEASAFKPKFSN